MWINRKEYKKLKDSEKNLKNEVEYYKIKNEDLKNDIENLKYELNSKKQEIENIEQVKRLLTERLEQLEKNYDNLLKNNIKLTEWINKIINEVGVYQVHDRSTIRIPIYINPIKAIYGNINDVKNQLEEFSNQEEILIPEIRFIRYKN